MAGIISNRVAARAALTRAIVQFRGLPILALVVTVVLEATLQLAIKALVPIAAVAIAVVVSATVQAYLVACLFDATTSPRRPAPGVAVRRLGATVGVRLLQDAIILVVTLVVVIGILVTVVALHPDVWETGLYKPVTPAATPFFPLISLLASVVLGRWFCAIPLVIDRQNGPVEALRRSWQATRGSTLRCTLLYAATWVPGTIALVVPGTLTVLAGTVAGVLGAVIEAMLSVALYRQLFPALRQSYPVTEVGRRDFEADEAILNRQGYVVATSQDVDGVRTISFGPATGLIDALTGQTPGSPTPPVWVNQTVKLPLHGLITRYEEWRVRKATPRLGAERARREVPALARFNLAALIWVIPIAAARFVSADYQLASYSFAVVWAPIVYLTWRTYQRARRS